MAYMPPFINLCSCGMESVPITHFDEYYKENAL
jgi:hypothetical protein